MPLKCGIVGLPNVGKSTLFIALTETAANTANFPFSTIDPNIGIITIPDQRLRMLEDIVHPKKFTPATIDIIDIAGLIKDASKGEGLGNLFLSHIRDVDAILHTIRCFDDPNIVHVSGKVDPVSDKEVIETELLLKDLETAKNRKEKIERQATNGDKEKIKERDVLTNLIAHFETGAPARSFEGLDDHIALIKELFLLTLKPVLYVCNVDEQSAVSGNHYTEALKEAIDGENAEMLIISADIESQLIELDDEADRKELLSELGLNETGIERLIHSAFKLLNLINYYTAGEQEVRAWTVPKDIRASKAAGVIHSDFERGFIRAEVIKYDDYVTLGSEKACKAAGKIKVEGKEYLVQDGDVMHFLFNV